MRICAFLNTLGAYKIFMRNENTSVSLCPLNFPIQLRIDVRAQKGKRKKNIFFRSLITTIFICFIQSFFVCFDWCSFCFLTCFLKQKKSENFKCYIKQYIFVFVPYKSYIFLKIIALLKHTFLKNTRVCNNTVICICND